MDQKKSITLVTSLEVPSSSTITDPPFQFSMCDFTYHRTHPWYCWYSPPFYTSKRGYKMCLGIDANGSGEDSKKESVAGRYTSVYVHLMLGGYDDSLWWPFVAEVKVTLLGIEETNNLEKVIRFHPDLDEKYSGQVTGRERSEFGWGDPSFVGHDKLCKFLENDTLRFKVEVKHECRSTES